MGANIKYKQDKQTSPSDLQPHCLGENLGPTNRQSLVTSLNNREALYKALPSVSPSLTSQEAKFARLRLLVWTRLK